jgi:glycosyltransferase involved in cell wall biosynthesis
MKLLFLHRFRNFAGAERQLIELANGLAAKGHEVVVVGFYASPRVQALLDPARVRFVSLEKSGRWDMPGFGWRLLRTLRRERPDIAHAYLGFANALLVLTKPFHRARVVWGVRSSDIDVSRYDRLARFDAWIERALARYPDLIISNSHAGRTTALQRDFPAARTIVIPNGVDLLRFARDEAGRERVRAEWGVDASIRVIGRVGRFDPQKDFESFIRAAAILGRDHLDYRFAIVGSDPHGNRAELATLAQDLGLADRIIWNGIRDDMPSVYSAFDLCVSSSAYGEGIPNVIVEAMACGVPCVTTDVGDSARTIARFGPVVPRSDPARLANGIATALATPPDSAAMRQFVAETFAMDRLVASTETALRSVIGWAVAAPHAEEARA